MPFNQKPPDQPTDQARSCAKQNKKGYVYEVAPHEWDDQTSTGDSTHNASKSSRNHRMKQQVMASRCNQGWYAKYGLTNENERQCKRSHKKAAQNAVGWSPAINRPPRKHDYGNKGKTNRQRNCDPRQNKSSNLPQSRRLLGEIFHATSPSGASIKSLNACINRAPSAPSIAR